MLVISLRMCLIFNAAFPLSSGPEVYLEQDASLPIDSFAGIRHRSRERRLQAYDLVELTWAKWKKTSSQALMESDAVWILVYCLLFLSNGKWDSTSHLLFPVSWFAITCPMSLAIRLPVRSVRSHTGCRNVGPLVAQDLQLNGRAMTAKSHWVLKSPFQHILKKFWRGHLDLEIHGYGIFILMRSWLWFIVSKMTNTSF